MAGHEASAIGSLRAIISSQQAFSSSCGNGFYASDLTDLFIAPTAGGAPFISPDLGGGAAGATVEKSGYSIDMNEGDGLPATRPSCSEPNGGPDETALFSGFVASASPTSAATGTRYFWTNTLGTIYFDVTDTLSGIDLSTQAPGVATAAPIQ